MHRPWASAIAWLLISACLSAAEASPCEGVDRAGAAREPGLARSIARQLNVPKVDLLQSFRDGRWRILYVDTHVADEAFLFFAGDPATARYVTMWSGGAAPNEERSIESWAKANAPGIPERLAACFAWHVTQDRDR